MAATGAIWVRGVMVLNVQQGPAKGVHMLWFSCHEALCSVWQQRPLIIFGQAAVAHEMELDEGELYQYMRAHGFKLQQYL